MGQTLSFYHRLVGTLLAPLVISACLLALAALVVRGRCASFSALVNSPASWTLHIWLCLLLYPVISQRSVAIFDCIQLRNALYLRADPEVQCTGNGPWLGWVFVGCIGITVYCVGIPVAAFLAARQQGGYHSIVPDGAATHRKRVALLLSSYHDAFWFFESLDLLRKFVLTSVVVIVAPNSKVCMTAIAMVEACDSH